MFRLGKVRDGMLSPPRIEGARCPKCRAKLVLTNVHEDVRYTFAGTFAENSDTSPLVEGRLVCPRVKKHTDELGYEMTTVKVNDSIAELITLLGDIADELGY